MINKINNFDYKITKSIYDLFNKKNISNIPYFLGLLPYEIYVIPGMYIAILQLIWSNSINPIQFHLLPHWFAFSIFQLLKKSIDRKRPGCAYKNLSKFIEKSHCTNGHENESFPSGHTGISFALATSLFMELNFSKFPQLFDISITNNLNKNIISFFGIFVAIMVALHRVSMGYHSFFDVIVGALIGMSIGFISWISIEYIKNLYIEICEDKKENTNDKKCKNYKTMNVKDNNSNLNDNKLLNDLMIFFKIILTIPILYLSFKFFTKDVFKLTNIKH